MTLDHGSPKPRVSRSRHDFWEVVATQARGGHDFPESCGGLGPRTRTAGRGRTRRNRCVRLWTMRELLVIGIGPGHPDQITVQAVQAINRVDVFFVIDKGAAKSGLNAAREEILRRHVAAPAYRVVEIPEPPRDRSPDLSADGYQAAVQDWHEA